MTREHVLRLFRDRVAPWTLAMALVACAPGLVVRPLKVDGAVSPRVAVYLEVSTVEGDPVVGLEPAAFRVFEAGQLVDGANGRVRVERGESPAVYRTLLLVDISHAALSGAQRGELQRAAIALVQAVALHQPVAVYAFDGARRLHPIAPFGTAGDLVASRFAERREIDPRTNLHGAVIEGLQELDRALGRQRGRLGFGTLVVLTDGSDHADRVDLQAVQDALQASPHRVLTVGVGNQADDSTLARVGRDGYVRVDDLRSLGRAIRLVAADVAAPQRSRYLLTYCGDPQALRPRVRVVVRRGRKSGEATFRAARQAGGPGCRPGDSPDAP